MKHDLLYALRSLTKKPTFTIVAIVTLALGIGANAAIFTVVNAVLLRPLPYPDPDRLLFVWTHNPRQGFDKDVATYPNYQDWMRQSRSFENVTAYTGRGFTLTGAGDPAQIRGAVVTANFFETLGVAPAVGGGFTHEQWTVGGADVALLGHGLWLSRFGADPGVIGRTISLNGVAHRVVGIMPRDFAHPEDAEVWVPLTHTPQFAPLLQSRGSFWLTVIGRLKPGVAPGTAQSEMDAIAQGLEKQYPSNDGLGIRLVPMHDEIVGDVRQPLLILLGAVCFVLLIACANVANLLLTRAASRQKELAIRAALGAGRQRLIRQMLTESVVLAFAGGIAGLLVAAWGLQALQSLAPSNLPRLSSVRIDMPVILYTALATLVTGLLFGLAPIVQGAATSAGESLKEGGRAGSEGTRARRMRSTVAVVEIAVALVLLIGAGLLVRTFLAMNRIDLGFEPRHVLALRVDLPAARYADDARIVTFFSTLADRLRSLPGVEDVGLGSSILLPALPNSAALAVEGQPPPAPGAPNIPVPYDAVTSGYFTTLRIPLKQGRFFTNADAAGAPPVAIVNESLVRRFFPKGDALGRRVTFGDPSRPDVRWQTIVGVVADTRRGGLERAPWAEVYFPQAQAADPSVYALLRTAGDPLTIARAAQGEVWAIDRDQPVASIRTVDAILAQSQANRRFTTLLLALFSVVALTLAAIGIYGVIAYSTAQRTQEIGIRMALGASRGHVLRMVLAEGLAIGGTGLVLGLAGAFALTRFMSGLLFGVGAYDPVTFVALPLGLLLVAAAATLIPAARAIRVNPSIALRGE